VAPGQAPGDSLPLVAPDAALCQRTTAALLRRIDAITVRWISHEAVKAGASAKILSEFQSSASLAAPDRELIAELSPDILVELGISPRQFPIVTAAAVVGLHSINLWQCVGELRDMQARVRAERLREEGGRPVTQPGPAIEQPPRPADPPGTMKVYCNESKNPPGPFDRPQSAEKAPG
jgi:hypothetical protein